MPMPITTHCACMQDLASIQELLRPLEERGVLVKRSDEQLLRWVGRQAGRQGRALMVGWLPAMVWSCLQCCAAGKVGDQPLRITAT